MEVITRRSRSDKQATTGTVQITEPDVRGLFEPLTRYARLPTEHLVRFDKRGYWYVKHRLGQFFHETQNWPLNEIPLSRLEQYGVSKIGRPEIYELHQTYIKNRPFYPADKWLSSFNVLNTDHIALSHQYKIGAPQRDNHNLYTILSIADIELAAPNFINHLKVFTDPLAFPIETEWRGTPLKRTLKPDGFFGLEYPDAVRFFFVEYDDGNEPEIPRQNLDRSSILQKLLLYRALDKSGELKKHGIGKFYVLFICPSQRRMEGMKKAVAAVCPEGSSMFAFQVGPHHYGTIPHPSRKLYETDWERVGRETVNLQHV